MDIALHTNMIVIRATQKELSKPWIHTFIAKYHSELLFLNRAIIMYHTEKQVDDKKLFLKQICDLFAQQEGLTASFFIKAIMCYLHYPIRLETVAMPLAHKEIHVHLKAMEHAVVTMTLPEKDPWFLLYMHTRLHPYILEQSNSDMHLELITAHAKASFEKSLNREYLFARKIHYHYNKDFLRTLFTASIRMQEDSMKAYYATLECPVGATLQELKHNYKRLVKQYHPDIIQHLRNDEKVQQYTKKFQALQEAFEALKGA